MCQSRLRLSSATDDATENVVVGRVEAVEVGNGRPLVDLVDGCR